jgi:cold-inducible RNA-binding protein
VATNCYVGNVRYGMTGADLQDLFERQGMAQSPPVIVDLDTGHSKGFGFIEMDNPDEAQAAIDTLNGSEVNGWTLTVKEVRPREKRFLRAPGEQFANDYFG